MVQITNMGRGPRGFNLKGAETKDSKASAPVPYILNPGESADIDLHDLDHPVIQGWIENGDIVLGAAFGNKPKAQMTAPGPAFDDMSEDVLRAYIEDRMGNGAKLDGKIARPALIAKAKELSGNR